MEQALLRGRSDHPLTIGDAVLVGPHTHLNGTTIDDEVFVATGVSMFPAPVPDGCELRINSVLHVNSELTPGTVVPSAGSPPASAQLFSPDRHDELWPVQDRSTSRNRLRRPGGRPCARSCAASARRSEPLSRAHRRRARGESAAQSREVARSRRRTRHLAYGARVERGDGPSPVPDPLCSRPARRTCDVTRLSMVGAVASIWPGVAGCGPAPRSPPRQRPGRSPCR